MKLLSHRAVFLLNSTVFTLLGLVCILAPHKMVELLMGSSAAASLTKAAPPLRDCIRLAGCVSVLFSSLLCTAGHHVTVDMSRSLAAGFAVAAMTCLFSSMRSSGTAVSVMPGCWLTLATFHLLNAAYLLYLAPTPQLAALKQTVAQHAEAVKAH